VPSHNFIATALFPMAQLSATRPARKGSSQHTYVTMAQLTIHPKAASAAMTTPTYSWPVCCPSDCCCCRWTTTTAVKIAPRTLDVRGSSNHVQQTNGAQIPWSTPQYKGGHEMERN
jgi:hypothetical protein